MESPAEVVPYVGTHHDCRYCQCSKSPYPEGHEYYDATFDDPIIRARLVEKMIKAIGLINDDNVEGVKVKAPFLPNNKRQTPTAYPEAYLREMCERVYDQAKLSQLYGKDTWGRIDEIVPKKHRVKSSGPPNGFIGAVDAFKFTPFPTLEAREEKVIEAMTTSKAACKQILLNSYIRRVTDSPDGEVNMKAANRKVNEAKGLQNLAGQLGLRDGRIDVEEVRNAQASQSLKRLEESEEDEDHAERSSPPRKKNRTGHKGIFGPSNMENVLIQSQRQTRSSVATKHNPNQRATRSQTNFAVDLANLSESEDDMLLEDNSDPQNAGPSRSGLGQQTGRQVGQSRSNGPGSIFDVGQNIYTLFDTGSPAMMQDDMAGPATGSSSQRRGTQRNVTTRASNIQRSRNSQRAISRPHGTQVLPRQSSNNIASSGHMLTDDNFAREESVPLYRESSHMSSNWGADSNMVNRQSPARIGSNDDRMTPHGQEFNDYALIDPQMLEEEQMAGILSAANSNMHADHQQPDDSLPFTFDQDNHLDATPGPNVMQPGDDTATHPKFGYDQFGNPINHEDQFLVFEDDDENEQQEENDLNVSQNNLNTDFDDMMAGFNGDEVNFGVPLEEVLDANQMQQAHQTPNSGHSRTTQMSLTSEMMRGSPGMMGHQFDMMSMPSMSNSRYRQHRSGPTSFPSQHKSGHANSGARNNFTSGGNGGFHR